MPLAGANAVALLAMMTFVGLPLLRRALEEFFGAEASKVRLRDLSAFTDPVLNWLMEGVREELMARRASALCVQGLAQLIAMHLARNYAEIPKVARGVNASLPGFKLKQITDWIEALLDAKFDLDILAAQAGLSRFHFHRLLKEATGVSPTNTNGTNASTKRADGSAKRNRASSPSPLIWASPVPATLRRFFVARPACHPANTDASSERRLKY